MNLITFFRELNKLGEPLLLITQGGSAQVDIRTFTTYAALPLADDGCCQAEHLLFLIKHAMAADHMGNKIVDVDMPKMSKKPSDTSDFFDWLANFDAKVCYDTTDSVITLASSRGEIIYNLQLTDDLTQDQLQAFLVRELNAETTH